MFIGPAGLGPKTGAKVVVALRTNGERTTSRIEVAAGIDQEPTPQISGAFWPPPQVARSSQGGHTGSNPVGTMRQTCRSQAKLGASPPSAAIRTYPGHGGASAPQSVSPASFRIALTWSERRL
jgi:hypothetical protein